MSQTFGRYPYPVYSVIQGGDGGMEYPMCTMILGERGLGSLVGVMAHEAAHSWYQAILASNESLYPWLDEGFADFASQESMAMLFGNPVEASHENSYNSYFSLVHRNLQEPLSQHSDHYNTNTAYGTAAYSMGTVFLQQLKYIIGSENFYRGMRQYFNTWKFRHPEPIDFIRVMEKVSGMQLKWYLGYWINTTKRIDYAIKHVVSAGENTVVTLERIGELPMPVDLLVTYKDGSKIMYYIPMNEMLGNKPVEDTAIQRIDLTPWPWVNPTYALQVEGSISTIALIEIDPSMRMADIQRKDNKLDPEDTTKPYEDTRR
jgi:hypothetical protein